MMSSLPTLVCFAEQISACVIVTFFSGNFLIFLVFFLTVVLPTTWSQQRPVTAISVHQQPWKYLIPPSSLEPDSGYVRISRLGPMPIYSPDPTLTTITNNRARASATDTWPWNIQAALEVWLAWNAARLPREIKVKVWHVLVHQAIAQKHRRRSHTLCKDELLTQ